MNNLIFTIIGFILGWACEKILDGILQRIKSLWHTRKLRKTLNNRVKDVCLTPNISIIGESLTNFDINEQVQVKLSDEEFLLTMPDELKKMLPATSKSYTNEDKWLDGCNIQDIENFFNIEHFSDIVEECRDEVAQNFCERKEGCYFNNRLFGVLYSDVFGRTPDERELPVLTLTFFKTDYFTHRLMWKITTKLREHHYLPNQNLNVKQLNSIYRCFRTSLGISILITLPDTNEIILTKRSSNSAYNEGKEWIYVSVTETISETDYDIYKGNLNLPRWIERALWEELGLQKQHYDENSIKIYDMFFENHFYQDGLTASVTLKHNISLDDVKALKAKDKNMEVKEIFSIENSSSAIKKYIATNNTQMREQTIFSLQSYMIRNL